VTIQAHPDTHRLTPTTTTDGTRYVYDTYPRKG